MSTTKKEQVLTFPEIVQKRLLEIHLESVTLQRESNTIVATFFAAVGIDNPENYEIDLKGNTIKKKPAPTGKTRPNKKGTKN